MWPSASDVEDMIQQSKAETGEFAVQFPLLPTRPSPGTTLDAI